MSIVAFEGCLARKDFADLPEKEVGPVDLGLRLRRGYTPSQANACARDGHFDSAEELLL